MSIAKTVRIFCISLHFWTDLLLYIQILSNMLLSIHHVLNLLLMLPCNSQSIIRPNYHNTIDYYKNHFHLRAIKCGLNAESVTKHWNRLQLCNVNNVLVIESVPR